MIFGDMPPTRYRERRAQLSAGRKIQAMPLPWRVRHNPLKSWGLFLAGQA
jgi:hypothetical protein